MYSKKGQFYLLAAIVIIAVIIGFVVVVNYAIKKGDVKLYDLGEEFGIEGGHVIEHGTYNEKSETEMESLLIHFGGVYASVSGEDKEIFFIFGNKEEVKQYSYTEEPGGSINLPLEGGAPSLIIIDREFNKDILPVQGQRVEVIVDDVVHYFDLREGENFYFIISQNIEGEQHVVQG